MVSTYEPRDGSGWFSGHVIQRHVNHDGRANGIVRVHITDPGTTWRSVGDVVDVGEAAETVTADALDARMGIDMPVVKVGGQSPSGATYVRDAIGIYAPDVHECDGEIDMAGANEWTLLDGYSGQYGYGGPIMHASEFIGGRMARDILATPGYYAAVVVYSLDVDPDYEDDVTGWAVAYREENGS